MTTKGFCQCGCGQRTRVAQRNEKRRGVRRGEYRLYVAGHQTRGRKINRASKPSIRHSSGYVLLRMPEHPKAHRGYVYEHVLVAERALGRLLPTGAQVHHANGDPSDNRPENLVICQDAAHHQLIHRRQRALEGCGHADWMRCRICREWDAPSEMRVTRTRLYQAVHPECDRAAKRARALDRSGW